MGTQSCATGVSRTGPGPGSRRRRHGLRRGASLMVVIGTLMVVSILAFSLSMITSQSMHRAKRMLAQEGAILLARSARTFALAKIYEGLGDSRSRIFATLIDKDLATGTTVPFEVTELNALAAEYPRATVAVTVSVARLAPLDPVNLTAVGGGFDEVERRASLTFHVSASVDGVPHEFLETRDIKIFSLIPGILGKFSLFVQQPDSNYNRYFNDLNGAPDPRAPAGDQVLPLVLKNGGELDEGATGLNDPGGWRRRGFVRFGGGAPVVLHLTAGNDDRYGESFHFYPANHEPIGIPGYYDPDPPGFFARPPDFSKTYPVSGNSPMPPFAAEFSFVLKHVVSGFYSKDALNADMNADGRLALAFPGPGTPGQPDPRMRSSSLHLFGTRSCPSPTLVLGDVRRRYADYAAVLVDATGDGCRDAVLTYLPQSAGPMAATPVPDNPILAAAGGQIRRGDPIRLDPDPTLFSCANMFAGDFSAYQDCMCQLYEDLYLRSHDYLYHRPPDDFVPAVSDFGSTGVAERQDTFRLELTPSLGRTSPFWNHGNLDGIPYRFLIAKCPVAVHDDREFAARFLDEDRVLTLDTNVLIRGGDGQTTTFPPGMKVRRGGIVVVERGDVSVGAIARDRRDPDVFLVIVALAGDIAFDSSHGSGRINASLCAPNGRLVNRSPSLPLDLTGSLVVRSLPADLAPAGGRIAYDTRSDPSAADYLLYYRGLVSNYAIAFEEGQ